MLRDLRETQTTVHLLKEWYEQQGGDMTQEIEAISNDKTEGINTQWGREREKERIQI